MATSAKKLLIVEDDSDVRNILTEAFEEEGYIVMGASDGVTAMVNLKNQTFDGIIMDLQIPGQSGLNLSALAKSSRSNKNTPLFICSGKVDERSRMIAKGLNIKDIIEKPFNIGKMVEIVSKRIEQATQPIRYDSKVISIFLEAATEVFEFYFKKPPQVGKPGVKRQGKAARGAITGLIGFTGKGYVGSMALSVNLPYIKGLAKILFPNETINMEKEAAADIVGEMCNQVLESVKKKFAAIGHEIDLGLPDVILGKGHIVLHKARNPVLYIPIGKDNMGCDLEFCLEEKENFEPMDQQSPEKSQSGEFAEEDKIKEKPDSDESGSIKLINN